MEFTPIPLDLILWLILTLVFYIACGKPTNKICSVFVCPPIIKKLFAPKYTIKEKMVAFSSLVMSYSFVTIIFSISVCPIASLILRSTKQAITTLDLQMGITSSVIIGMSASALMRVFVLSHSMKIIKALYLNTTISLSGLLLFVYPFQVFPGAKEFFGPIGDSLREMITFFFLWEVSFLLIVVVLLTELVILASGRSASISLFRERRESVEVGTQYLTREELIEDVKKMIDQDDLHEIRWLTWEGDRDVGNRIVEWKSNLEKKCEPYILKILITPEVERKWNQTGLLANFRRDHYKVTNVGILRFLIFDRSTCIEALPMPPSLTTGANTGLKINEPSRVRELFSFFEAWWNDVT